MKTSEWNRGGFGVLFGCLSIENFCANWCEKMFFARKKLGLTEF